MKPSFDTSFNQNCKSHLKLKGLQPEATGYSRVIRRIGEHFDRQIDNLSEQQLPDHST